MNKKTSRLRRGARTKAIVTMHSDRPRLVVYRSASHIYAQVVEEGENGDVVLASASTLGGKLTGTGIEKAKQVGKLLGERANKIKVSFDRSGYKYHGRIKALAEGAREAGLDF